MGVKSTINIGVVRIRDILKLIELSVIDREIVLNLKDNHSSMSQKKNRQAVVVIHGIGEQRPMSTLRDFVNSLLSYERRDEEGEQPTRDWIKPDRISESYELRKITAKAEDGIRSTTHFYEYHWAGNMRDTKAKHVASWLGSLMKRNLAKAPDTLWYLKYFCWLVLGLYIAYPFRVSICHLFLSSESFMSDHSLRWVLLLVSPFILAQWVFPKIFVGYLGDAARYMRNATDNLAQRETIRRNGVQFLKGLHKDGDYDRIIIVGHSLGSVIAYDLLTYLWIDFNKSVKVTVGNKRKVEVNKRWLGSLSYAVQRVLALDKLSDAAIKLSDKFDSLFGDYIKRNIPVQRITRLKEFQNYRNAQLDFFDELYSYDFSEKQNKGWLISDLITLGSPLTHGDILMADTDKEFEKMIKERQYPSCPPVKDYPWHKKEEDIEPKDYFIYGNIKNQQYLNHGTPFFPTRWTNLYFKGDFIGGPVSPQFGPGVRDKQVVHNPKSKWKWLHKISPLAHNHYWASDCTSDNIKEKKEYLAIKCLYDAMRLDDLS